jgi:hypothetical protein
MIIHDLKMCKVSSDPNDENPRNLVTLRKTVTFSNLILRRKFRVTRLADFSPVVRAFTFNSF